jgi:hypothetical protein
MARIESQIDAVVELDLCITSVETKLNDLLNSEIEAKIGILLHFPIGRIEEIREKLTTLKEVQEITRGPDVSERAFLKQLPDHLGLIPDDGARFKLWIDWKSKLELIYLFLERDLRLSVADLRQVVFDAVVGKERMKTVVLEAVADAEAALAGERAKSRNRGTGSDGTTSESGSGGGTEGLGVDRAPPGSARKVKGLGGPER